MKTCQLTGGTGSMSWQAQALLPAIAVALSSRELALAACLCHCCGSLRTRIEFIRLKSTSNTPLFGHNQSEQANGGGRGVSGGVYEYSTRWAQVVLFP